MPKLKTKRGVRRRFKITGSGKILSYHAGTKHFMRRKRANRKRKLSGTQVVSSADIKKVRRMLPYGL